MSEAWSECVGHVINGEFPLEQYLGGSEQSAVFLTERPGSESSRAAIKIVSADANADLRLSQWRLAQGFAHPHLIRIFDSGRCRLLDRDLLFVVMDYAEENLAQIIPERPLTAGEAQEMLAPLLDTLAWLHSKNLVHGRLKPSNILAIKDQLKLSSDGICAFGASINILGKPCAYDAPESASTGLTPGSDVWSLGVSLAEVLTQRVPAGNVKAESEPISADALPAPFSEIVRGCLHPDPAQRWTLSAIAAHLQPQPSPVTSEPPLEATPPSPAPVVAPQINAPRSEVVPPPANARATLARRRLLLTAVAVVAVVILAGWALRLHRETTSASPESRSNAQPTSSENAPVGSASHSKPSPVPHRAQVRTAQTKPAPQRGGDAAPTDHAPLEGAVVHQVLPDVPQSARDTIQGTVRVGIRVQVDRSGAVVGTALESAGPSAYFARLALQAAQNWTFTPGSQDMRTFTLRFQFTNTATRASAAQAP